MNEVYRVQIEVLTPLHIWNGGVDLQRDWDFDVRDDTVYFFDLDRLYAELWNGQGEVPLPTGLLRRPTDRYVRYKAKLVDRSAPSRVKPTLKDPTGRPYLPGSSLKGLFHTALAWKRYRGPLANMLEKQERNTKEAAKRLEANFFGEDPHHSVMRTLKVSDMVAIDTTKELWVAPFELHSLDRNQRLQNVGPKRGRWEYLEVTPPGWKFQGTVALDKHLMGAGVAKELRYDDHKIDAIKGLWTIVGEFGKELLNRQMNFFNQHGQTGIAGYLAELAKDRRTLACLGWGGGWWSKTIGLKLLPQEVKEIQDQFRLKWRKGRHFPSIFPASRRLVRTQAGLLPLGWIALHVEELP